MSERFTGQERARGQHNHNLTSTGLPISLTGTASGHSTDLRSRNHTSRIDQAHNVTHAKLKASDKLEKNLMDGLRVATPEEQAVLNQALNRVAQKKEDLTLEINQDHIELKGK